jgi:hypothetical protein
METLFVLVIGALMIWGVTMGLVTTSTENACLSKGYAESKVTGTFQQYCIKRDYQGSMYAVPLSKA